jgi:hypothetical protein
VSAAVLLIEGPFLLDEKIAELLEAQRQFPGGVGADR